MVLEDRVFPKGTRRRAKPVSPAPDAVRAAEVARPGALLHEPPIAAVAAVAVPAPADLDEDSCQAGDGPGKAGGVCVGKLAEGLTLEVEALK